MRKATRLSLGLLLLVTACASTPAGPRFTEGLPNFVKVNGHLYRGGQPTVPAGVQALAASGIETVIDLRQPDDRDPPRAAEQAAVEAAGMQYVSEPLPGWAAPDRQAVERLLAVIEDPTRQPVFIHCRRGADRTGTIVAIYRLRHDCWSAEQAIGEARAHDMSIWEIGMRHFVREWYEELDGRECVPAP